MPNAEATFTRMTELLVRGRVLCTVRHVEAYTGTAWLHVAEVAYQPVFDITTYLQRYRLQLALPDNWRDLRKNTVCVFELRRYDGCLYVHGQILEQPTMPAEALPPIEAEPRRGGLLAWLCGGGNI